MASFDVGSLFTNIILNETIDTCLLKHFPCEQSKTNGIHREEFKHLLEVATKEYLFIFGKEYNSQLDGVAMGSPLGPTPANIFLYCHVFQTNFIDNLELAEDNVKVYNLK